MSAGYHGLQTAVDYARGCLTYPIDGALANSQFSYANAS